MKKRYYEVDLARSLFILLIPLTHVFEYWGSWGGMACLMTAEAEKLLAPIICVITVFGAPTFMTCLGMNLVFSKNASPEKLFRRGIRLLMTELCFNLLRYVLPGLIGVAIGGTDTEDAAEILFWMVYGLINSDILAFSGLAFLVFALLKKLDFSAGKVALTGFLCFAVNELLAIFVSPQIDESCNYFFSELLGNLFYVNGDSTFPLLSWLIFPCFGYFFGKRLVERDSRKLWLLTGAAAALCLLAAILAASGSEAGIAARLNATEMANRLDPLCALGEVSASFLFICVCHLLFVETGLEKHEKLRTGIESYSACITYNYLVQWTVIGWVLFLTGGTHHWHSQTMGIGATLLCGAAIAFLSAVIGRCLQKKDRKIGLIS